MHACITKLVPPSPNPFPLPPSLIPSLPPSLNPFHRIYKWYCTVPLGNSVESTEEGKQEGERIGGGRGKGLGEGGTSFYGCIHLIYRLEIDTSGPILRYILCLNNDDLISHQVTHQWAHIKTSGRPPQTNENWRNIPYLHGEYSNKLPWYYH